MHYYKRNIGDYHRKAGRLSMLEHGAYTLLIDACYDREKFPTRDQAMVWCLARTPDEVAAVEFVLFTFFDADQDGRYIQNHIIEDLTAYHGNKKTNKRIALEREEKRRKSKQGEHEACTDGDDTSTNLHLTNKPLTNKPLTNNHKPKDIKQERSQVLADFELLWSSFDSAYGEKGSKKNALSQWMKINPDSELFGLIMDGLYKQRSEKQMKQSAGEFYAPFQHVERWLKNRRWEDEISVVNFSRAKPTREQRIEQALNEAFGTSDTGAIEGNFETIIGNGFVELVS